MLYYGVYEVETAYMINEEKVILMTKASLYEKMDLESLGRTFLMLYAAVIAVYGCILYGVCSYRYHMAKKSVGGYSHTLQKISDIYAYEEKSTASGAFMEETEK